MKFPKSMHADGWADHFEDAAAAPVKTSPRSGLNAGFKAGAKPVSAHTPLHGEPLQRTQAASVAAPVVTSAYAQAAAARIDRPTTAGTSASSPVPRSYAVPWAIGAGVGALLIGGAVVMSRNMAPSEPATPLVVGQATPVPEDVQLQTAPPSAGVVTPAPEVTPAPVETPATKAADEAPAVKPAPAETRTPPVAVAAAPAPKVQAPAPVVRTLTPQPEVLAQASPPPVLREAPQAVTPVPAPAATPMAPAVLPPDTAATPVVPPVAAAPATPPVFAPPTAAAAPDPVDTGITVQVRQALAADSALAAVPIAVSTDHGVVKLEGQAPDAQARERATVVAAATTGVKAVDNRLTLPPMAALDGKAASNGG